jgi:PAS domain S-box-containing protein
MSTSFFSSDKTSKHKTAISLNTLDTISANVMIADPDRNIIYMNQSVTGFLQEAEETIKKDLPAFNVKTLIGQNIDIFHKNPDHQRGMIAALKKPFSTTIKVGGRLFDLVANPIFDQAGKRLGTSVEWKDAELRLQNNDFKSLADALSRSQAIIHFNLDGTIITANENFLNTLGYSLDEIQGKHHSMFVDNEFRNTQEYKYFWDSLRAGEFQSAEYKRIGKGGREIWIQASYNPIFDSNGKPFKVVKYATDITAQVLARFEKQRIGSMVDQNLGSIVDAVGNASRQTTSAASSSSQAATTVQTIAAAAEELNSSIQEIASSMAHSKTAVAQAIELTAQADSSTQELSKAASQMGGIVAIIQDIANQINLLALNATIESARAGDAGKGFAVVASEVKNLATQVAQATDKISQEITGMQVVSSDVIHALESIKEAVQSVEAGVTGVASAIEEQSAVTTQMSSHMQTASIACSEVDDNLKQILSSMEISNQYTVEVQELSKNLVQG